MQIFNRNLSELAPTSGLCAWHCSTEGWCDGHKNLITDLIIKHHFREMSHLTLVIYGNNFYCKKDIIINLTDVLITNVA